jgi:hypothetical protein
VLLGSSLAISDIWFGWRTSCLLLLTSKVAGCDLVGSPETALNASVGGLDLQ